MIVRVTPTKAKSYLEKLVLQDGVKFIFGTPTSNPATDTEVTEPNKVILLGIDVTGTGHRPQDISISATPMGMFFSRGYLYAFVQGHGELGA